MWPGGYWRVGQPSRVGRGGGGGGGDGKGREGKGWGVKGEWGSHRA